ncbi:MAG: TerB N-terminal domain-containing protein [Aggregatilineales bacterium]
MLDQLRALFSSPPVVVTWRLGDGGINIAFSQNGKPLAFPELVAPRLAKLWPNSLSAILEHFSTTRGNEIRFSFAQAQELYKQFASHPNRRIELNSDALTRLVPTTVPHDFAVRWRYNEATSTLHRQLVSAEHALGNGWFQQDTKVWQLNMADASPKIGTLLNTAQVSSADFLVFLEQALPFARANNWPITCELDLLPQGIIRLEIVKMLDRSLDVRLTSTPPEIVRNLHVIPNDDQSLMSGHYVIPQLGSVLNGDRLAALRTGQAQRIAGDDVPMLIQDVLRHNAGTFGVDIHALDARYPIRDAANLKISWQVEYGVSHGVGHYDAVLHLITSSENFSRKQLQSKLKASTRFLRTNTGWLELTPHFAQQLWQYETNPGIDFTLEPSELLGGPSTRVSKAGLSIPKLEMPSSENEMERGQLFVEMLRVHGVPGGFSGLGDDRLNILVNECARLLSSESQARILWLAPRDQHGRITLALKRAGVPSYVMTGVTTGIGGAVLITDVSTSPPGSSQWTLIIFLDVDKLLQKREMIDFWQRVKRGWALITLPRPFRQYNPNQQAELMRILQLAPALVDSFGRMCFLDFSQPQENILQKLTSPFKRVVIEDNSFVASGPIPIPPRPANSINRPPTPVKTVLRSNISISVTIGNKAAAKQSFVSQARQWANRVEPTAEPVPFMQYWPTYAAMSPAQQHWYFYWRGQLRQGNRLPTDLSYLFVYIYELINVVGVETPQVAYDTLISFWSHYRSLQPKLDNYLVEWIADFSAFYNLPQKPLMWYAQAAQVGANVRDTELTLEAWRTTSADIRRIPLPVLFALANYSPAANKFYQEYNANGSVDAAYLKSIAAVDSHIRAKMGTGLFNMYRSEPGRDIRRVPFASAVNEYPQQPILIAHLDSTTDSARLAVQLQAAIKYTENLLRARANFKGKLRGVELPADWAQVINTAHTIEAPRRRAAIDMSKVEQLTRDSLDVRAMLTVEDIPAPASLASSPETTPSSAVPIGQEITRPTAKQTRSKTVEIAALLPAQLAPIYKIIGSNPDSPIRGLLRVLQQHQWQASADVLQNAIGNEFLSTLVDRINERALDQIGDNLLFEENGQWLIADDFRDDLGFLLEHPDPIVESSGQPDYNALTDEWSTFAKLLQSSHWKLLEALLAGVNVSLALDQIARGAHTMPTVLIEEINGQALDHLGGLIVDTMDEPPKLIDEMVDGVRTLMAWAVNQPTLLR